jgi:hypothetical protein
MLCLQLHIQGEVPEFGWTCLQHAMGHDGPAVLAHGGRIVLLRSTAPGKAARVFVHLTRG